MPPGPPGPPGVGIPFRPGTVPASSTYPPQVTFPQPTQPYAGVIPPVVPHGYRTPSVSGSPVFPSPPSREGDRPFVPPDLGPSRASAALPPHIYRPPIPPGGEEDIFVPPEPSYRSGTPSTESPRRSPSLVPVVPGPQIFPQGPAPPFLVPSRTRSRRTPSYDRSRSRTPPSPPPVAGPSTIINMPPQPGFAAPGVPMIPSTQPPFDLRDQPILGAPIPMAQTPRRSRSESPGFDERRDRRDQPIIIQPPVQQPMPPGQTFMPPGQLGPQMVPIGPMVGDDTRRSRTYSRSRSRSTSPTRSRSPSPRPSTFVPGFPQPPMMGPVSGPPTMMGGPPLAPGMMGLAPMPMGMAPVPQPIPTVQPSRRPSEYRSPTPESRSPYRSPSRAPSRFSDRDRFQPVGAPMIPMPASAIHIEPTPYPRSRRTRYSRSRTPSSERDRSLSPERRRRRRRGRSPEYSRSPSIESEERDSRRRRRSRYRSPSTVFPAPGPEFGPGVGPLVLPPGTTHHVHTYPPPGSPTRTSMSPYTAERESEALPHPYPSTQYLPELVQVPPGRTPSGRSRAPTIVEVTGPEPIQVLPPPAGRPRAGSGRKYCICRQRSS